MHILQLDSGLFVGTSVSRQLTADIVKRLQAQHQATVTHRDLVLDPIPHLDAAALTQDNPLTNQLIDELKAADAIVIGAPMYNFTIPTQLKAWFDRIVKAGVTFKYTDQGPQGLLPGKTVYIASGRGGIYSSGNAAAMDHQESYLRTLLGFIGLNDIHLIRAEGVNMGDEPRQQALAAAAEDIAAL